MVQYTDQNETSSYVKINSTATGQVPETNGTINSSHWAIFAKVHQLLQAIKELMMQVQLMTKEMLFNLLTQVFFQHFYILIQHQQVDKHPLHLEQ